MPDARRFGRIIRVDVLTLGPKLGVQPENTLRWEPEVPQQKSKDAWVLLHAVLLSVSMKCQ